MVQQGGGDGILPALNGQETIDRVEIQNQEA